LARFLNRGEPENVSLGPYACPVEPGTLRVFNWGAMPRSPISVLKRLPGKQGSDVFIMIRQKMSGNTTQMRGINAQYESIE